MPGLFLCTRSRAAAVELVPRGRVAGGRKFVDTTTLRRINEKARTVGYGPTALPRLFEDANRALLHVAHAVSFDRMQGRESPLTDATVWNRGGVDVLLVVWWVRLLDGETVALAIGAQPSDFLPLESTVIGEAMLERAHEMPVRCPPRRRHPLGLVPVERGADLQAVAHAHRAARATARTRACWASTCAVTVSRYSPSSARRCWYSSRSNRRRSPGCFSRSARTATSPGAIADDPRRSACP
jgi:hypothetical protein